MVARLFLADNVCRIRFNPGDAVKTMEAVASGALGEAALAVWFRQRLEDVNGAALNRPTRPCSHHPRLAHRGGNEVGKQRMRVERL